MEKKVYVYEVSKEPWNITLNKRTVPIMTKPGEKTGNTGTKSSESGPRGVIIQGGPQTGFEGLRTPCYSCTQLLKGRES